MKKVFYLIALSVLILQTTNAQELLVKNEVLPTKVSGVNNLNKAVFDYSAVEQIREHIMNDKVLSSYMDLHRPIPQMKVEVRVNSKGDITEVNVIEGGNGEHAFLLKKSIHKLKTVTPIKIDGINVNQRVLIPVLFK
ncbi:MAG: hypothetical protein ACJA01_001612 [Saprospiraceae bacterium]|jgi:hypothetical protein